jgi:hypothetical protein
MTSSRFEDLARALATGTSRRRILRGISAVVVGSGATSFHVNRTEAKDKVKDKPKPSKGTCPTAHLCCHCYNDTGYLRCTTDVRSQEDCAVFCNNAAGGQYGFNDPAVISPGNDIVCGPDVFGTESCTIVRCKP